MRPGLLLIALLAAVLPGCGETEAPPPMPEPGSAAPSEEEPDSRMRAINGADAVGYDGDAIQRSVQGVKDRADERQRRADAATQGP